MEDSKNTNFLTLDGFHLSLIVTFVAIVVIYLLTRRRRSSYNVVLFVGLSGSGKTALFTKLIFNKQKHTVSSLRENQADNKDLNLRVIDIPGAERLRVSYWEQFRSKANHVIFVVDSKDFQAKLRDTSEYLYSILSDSTIHKNKMKCTVACNKHDLDQVLSKTEIERELNTELNAIRETKKGQLGKTSDQQDEDYLDKYFDKDEKISLSRLQISLIETSMYNLENLMRILI